MQEEKSKRRMTRRRHSIFFEFEYRISGLLDNQAAFFYLTFHRLVLTILLFEV